MATPIVAPKGSRPRAQSSHMDDFDRLSAVSKQLSALLHMTFGETGDSFRNHSDDIQDNFMWACGDMADEIAKLVDVVFSAEADHA